VSADGAPSVLWSVCAPSRLASECWCSGVRLCVCVCALLWLAQEKSQITHISEQTNDIEQKRGKPRDRTSWHMNLRSGACVGGCLWGVLSK
jgi:hypothetical protein